MVILEHKEYDDTGQIEECCINSANNFIIIYESTCIMLGIRNILQLSSTLSDAIPIGSHLQIAG